MDATVVLDGFTVTGGNASVLNNRLGGGMYNYKSSATITNCTFSGNAASYDGGGMRNYNVSLTLTNCILWTNSDSDGVNESAQIHTDGGKLVINYCCVQGWTGSLGGTDNISKDPLFVDMAAGDYHLRRNSPCIDAGNPNSDFSLEPKPNGGRINIGAYGNTPEATSRVP